MAADPSGSPSWWEWLMGLAFGAAGGMFLFTHKRIGEVQTELKGDQVQEITALRGEIARMERTFNDRFQEGREDRGDMWRTIEELQKTGAEQHNQNLERLSKIPTRDEMMQMLQQFARRNS